MPARTCQRTRRRKAASSSAPSVVNGVTRAVNAPRRLAGRGDRASRCGSWLARCRVRRSGGGTARRAARAARRRPGRMDGCPARAAPAEPVRGSQDAGRIGRRSRAVSRSSTVSPAASKPTRCMPGEAPARIDDDLERRRGGARSAHAQPGASGVPLGDPAGEVGAVPDGRSAFAGGATRGGTGRTRDSAPNSSAAASTSRPNRATPRLKLAATTAAAPRSRRTSSTAARSDAQPVVAMTKRRHAGRRARRRRSARTARPATRRRRRRRRGAPARSCRRARAGRRSRTPCPRRRARRAMAQPRRPSPRMKVCIVVVLTVGGTRHRCGGQQKDRGHRRGVRGPWSLRSRRPRFVVCAPSEPQGPCLPAGPPELLLRLGREGAAHGASLTHNRCPLQPFPGELG